jgi:hypothetical protein
VLKLMIKGNMIWLGYGFVPMMGFVINDNRKYFIGRFSTMPFLFSCNSFSVSFFPAVLK